MPSLSALSLHVFGSIAFLGGCLNLAFPNSASWTQDAPKATIPILKGLCFLHVTLQTGINVFLIFANCIAQLTLR